jgi:protein-disulfide isomerase
MMVRLPSMKWIETFATATLAMCALIVTGIVVKREFSQPRPEPLKPVFVKDWQKYAASDERVGSSTAPVKVIVFSDFECPFCRQLASNLDELIQKNPAEIEVIHRNFPLVSVHPFARAAAIAGECATAQGRFEDFYHFMFAHQDSLGSLGWSEIATRAGVQDTTRFRTCMADSMGNPRLHADSLAAAALDERGTPMIIVNGWKVEGSPPADELGGLVSRALKEEEKR